MKLLEKIRIFGTKDSEQAAKKHWFNREGKDLQIIKNIKFSSYRTN